MKRAGLGLSEDSGEGGRCVQERLRQRQHGPEECHPVDGLGGRRGVLLWRSGAQAHQGRNHGGLVPQDDGAARSGVRVSGGPRGRRESPASLGILKRIKQSSRENHT